MSHHCRDRSGHAHAGPTDRWETSAQSRCPSRQRQILIVTGVDRFKLFAFHPHAVAAFHEFHSIDIELLQEGPDAHDVTNLALFRQNLSYFLAGIGSIISDDPLCLHLLAEAEIGRLGNFDDITIANNIAHTGISLRSSCSPNKRDCTISLTKESVSSINS